MSNRFGTIVEVHEHLLEEAPCYRTGPARDRRHRFKVERRMILAPEAVIFGFHFADLHITGVNETCVLTVPLSVNSSKACSATCQNQLVLAHINLTNLI